MHFGCALALLTVSCTGSIFAGSSGHSKNVYFSQSPPLLCSLSDNDQITEAAWIKIAEGVAASKSLQNLKHGARSCILLPLFFCTPRCRTKIAYFLHFPSLLFCSLSYNEEITEAAWIKIAEGVAASKSLQKLEYGARSAFCFLISIDRLSAEQKSCLLFTFPLPSFLQLAVLPTVWCCWRGHRKGTADQQDAH